MPAVIYTVNTPTTIIKQRLSKIYPPERVVRYIAYNTDSQKILNNKALRKQ